MRHSLFFMVTVSSLFLQAQANEDLTPETTLTRKKNTVSLIFGGLAQTCTSLANLVTAETQKEKQQAALNTIGAVLNTTAQLAAPSENKQQKNSDTQQEEQTREITAQPQNQAPVLDVGTLIFLNYLDKQLAFSREDMAAIIDIIIRYKNGDYAKNLQPNA